MELKTVVQNDYEEYGKEYLEDACLHGCESGCVSGLIYYNDTLKFYGDHRKEINDLLTYWMDGIGVDSPSGLFGDKWDKSDPLANDTNNQNLLAWFAYEETARMFLQDELGIEL